MKRLFDIILVFALIPFFAPVLMILAIFIKATSKGPVFHFSRRVGKDSSFFYMVKLRTMMIDTPQVATHLMDDPKRYLTSIGGFLRKTSLDELPQLWNVLSGQMSFVGPRPALYNQDDLMALRIAKGVDKLVPGITGWAQINGRDDISIEDKVDLEAWYGENRSFLLDLKIMALTAFKATTRRDVSH